MKKLIAFVMLFAFAASFAACGGEQKDAESIPAPENEDYIVTHSSSELSELNSRAVMEMDYLCTASCALVEFTVMNEAKTVEYIFRDEEELAIIEQTKDEYNAEDYKARVDSCTVNAVRMELPVRYDKVYYNNEEDRGKYEDDVLGFCEEMFFVKDSYPAGARFLAFTHYGQSYDENEPHPVCDIWLFYIDADNKIFPVFDVAPINEYKGVSVDEFVETVLEIRNTKKA